MVLGSEGSGPVSPTPSELGSVIRRLRQERELSIESLAAAAGIHTTYLSGIERGRRNPSWIVIGALANALGVEISDLARLAEELAGLSGVGPKGH
jgi:transcriptional regulator with XRE-family HTH domain